MSVYASCLLLIGILAGGVEDPAANAADLEIKSNEIGNIKKIEPKSKPKLEKVTPKPAKTKVVKPKKATPGKATAAKPVKPKKLDKQIAQPVKPKKLDKQITRPAPDKLKKLEVAPKGGGAPARIKKAAIQQPGNTNQSLKKDLIKPSDKTLVKDLEPGAPGTQPLKTDSSAGVVSTSTTGLQVNPDSSISNQLASPDVKDLAVQPQIREGLSEDLKESLGAKLDGDNATGSRLQGLTGKKGSSLGERAGIDGQRIGKKDIASSRELVGSAVLDKGGFGRASVLQDAGGDDVPDSPTYNVIVNGTRYVVTGGNVTRGDTGENVRNYEYVQWWYRKNKGVNPHKSWIAKNESAVEEEMGDEVVSDAEWSDIQESYKSESSKPDLAPLVPRNEDNENDQQDESEDEVSEEDSFEWASWVDALFGSDEENDTQENDSRDGEGGDSSAGGGDQNTGDADTGTDGSTDSDVADSDEASCPEGDEDCSGAEGGEEAGGDGGRTVLGDPDDGHASCEEAGGCEHEGPADRGDNGTIRMAGDQEGKGGPLKGDVDTSPAGGTLRMANEENLGGELVRGNAALKQPGGGTLRLPEGEDDEGGGTPQVAGGSSGGGIGNPGVVTDGVASGGGVQVQQELNLQSGELNLDTESLENVGEQAGQ